jgi:hypothetical protein
MPEHEHKFMAQRKLAIGVDNFAELCRGDLIVKGTVVRQGRSSHVHVQEIVLSACLNNARTHYITRIYHSRNIAIN